MGKLKLFLLVAFSLLNGLAIRGQFHPAAGKPGSNAIQKDDNVFIAWANNCKVTRGLADAADSLGEYASFGDESNAVGQANGAVVSLGDAGEAVLFFETPIANGPGYDFAVFENAFNDTYLELAFVEVSSDGINYVRFPAASLSDTINQVSSFGNLNPEKLNNLAGKYRVFWGTPFDLQELADSSFIDVLNIQYVKIIDVIGSLDARFCSYDAFGQKVNDPYPTNFESGGFDLDAVGVINNQQSLAFNNINVNPNQVHAFPNPSHKNTFISIKVNTPVNLFIYDMKGRLVQNIFNVDSTIQLSAMQQGNYILKWIDLANNTNGTLKLNVYE